MPDSAPVLLRVEVRNLDSMFDTRAEPAFPHTRRLVDPRLAEFLEKLVREHRRGTALELRIELRDPPQGPSDVDLARRDLQDFFRIEGELTELELRVNQREGWGFFRRSFPLLLVALTLAGVLTVFGPSFPAGPVGELVTALFYLLFITIVWVLLWDPVEKLLFDAYLLRSRIAALEKLGGMPLRFDQRPTR